jgi:DNA-binding HxlR family transcriptional regulator
MADPQPPSPSPPPSALGAAVATVGDRWALLVVHALLPGPRRFNQLQEDLPGIAPNVLTQRLRHLERQAVLRAVPYSQRPPRVVYELTASGQELAGALRLLAQWGAGRSDEAEPLRHPTCGSPLEARWWCPTCDRVVDDAESASEEIRFL